MNVSLQGEATHNELDELEKLLTLDDKRILELGCGKAEITRAIATNGSNRKITATEVDEVQHADNILIDDLPNVDFLLAGAENIPLDDALFDIVFMFKSLHHVPGELMNTALSEIKRILKPGGFAYISEPVFKGDFNEVLRIFHDEEEVRNMAYTAINKSIELGELSLVNELFFNIPTSFENFKDFERRVINVTHTNHELPEQLITKVKNQFMLNMSTNGANFIIPVRVNLLRKLEN